MQHREFGMVREGGGQTKMEKEKEMCMSREGGADQGGYGLNNSERDTLPVLLVSSRDVSLPFNFSLTFRRLFPYFTLASSYLILSSL